MSWTAALAAAALLSLGIGCSGPTAREATETSRTAIVGGSASGPAQDGVVLLRAAVNGGDVLCTASLVGSNLLITARHCVSYFTDGLFSCSVQGELINDSDGAGELGLHLPASSLEVYGSQTPRTLLAHGKQVISTLSPVICINDLAFVVLDREVDLPIVPLRLGRPALAHESVTLVGYGLDGQQPTLDYRSAPRRQKTGLEVVALGPDSAADGIKTVPPRALILEGPSGCIGDSGGPLLAAATGAVLGIYSLQQAESCAEPTVRHQLVHVPPFGNLIDEAFAAAGVMPLVEPTSEPDGGGGAGSGGVGGEGEAGMRLDPSPAAGFATEAEAGAPASPGSAPRSSCSVAPQPAAPLEPALSLLFLVPWAKRRGSRGRRKWRPT
jgi:hypothetical protein